MKLAISVWLWRRRLLLFVFLASLKLSLGICILSQGGLWVTVSTIVAWPGCLAVLRACFGLHTIRIVFERVWGLVCHLIYLPFYILVGRVHNDYIGVVGNLLALYLFGRILSQMRMVFPFVYVKFFQVVVLRTSMYRKWVFYQRKFGIFGGALEPLFKMCGRFAGSLCTAAEG